MRTYLANRYNPIKGRGENPSDYQSVLEMYPKRVCMMKYRTNTETNVFLDACSANVFSAGDRMKRMI